MKLINVDEVIEKLKMAAEPYTINPEADYFVDDFVDGLGMAYSVILNTPTVDAIPVEWIENLINEIDKSICNLELETKYDYQVLAHALERRIFLAGLIRYWRKQNETSDSNN